jgi:hypothetical protein
VGALSLVCQKRSLAARADFDFHRLRISKIAGKFNEFQTAKADFVFLTRASRFFGKRSKNRLCKAYFLCAKHIFSVQPIFSLCNLYFLCAEQKFSAQDIFSSRKTYFPRAERIFRLRRFFKSG